LVKATVKGYGVITPSSITEDQLKRKKIQRLTNLNSHPPNAIIFILLFFFGFSKKCILYTQVCPREKRSKGSNFGKRIDEMTTYVNLL
jgi:hypothetical protein